MRERIEGRLAELRREMAAGEQLLAQLNRQLADTQQVLLRISGAIQVLEEVLAGAAEAPATADKNTLSDEPAEGEPAPG